MCACEDLSRSFHPDRDRPPLALIEAQHAQRAARHVADEDRYPDVDGLKCSEFPKHEADAEREDDL